MNAHQLSQHISAIASIDLIKTWYLDMGKSNHCWILLDRNDCRSWALYNRRWASPRRLYGTSHDTYIWQETPCWICCTCFTACHDYCAIYASYLDIQWNIWNIHIATHTSGICNSCCNVYPPVGPISHPNAEENPWFGVRKHPAAVVVKCCWGRCEPRWASLLQCSLLQSHPLVDDQHHGEWTWNYSPFIAFIMSISHFITMSIKPLNG